MLSIRFISRTPKPLGNAVGFVPGSKSPAHIRENAEIFDFALSAGDTAQIAALNRHKPFYQVTPESLQRLAVTKCKFED